MRTIAGWQRCGQHLRLNPELSEDNDCPLRDVEVDFPLRVPTSAGAGLRSKPRKVVRRFLGQPMAGLEADTLGTFGVPNVYTA